MSHVEWSDASGDEQREALKQHDSALNEAASGLDEEEESFHNWLFVAIWAACATVATVWWAAPADAWHEWPLVWGAAFFLTGIPLIGVIAITTVVHGFWWKHLRKRDFPWRRFHRRVRGRWSRAGDIFWTLVIWGMIAAFLVILLAGVAEKLGVV